jgi:phosphoribosylformimino-5-aminoimidazole carboxamide ribonucleotide (ProFAR) isomerase
MAVLIPSIDLMGGKIVQLVRGEKKALEFTNFDEWIARFSKYSIVQLIDLDAAIGNGDNRSLVQQFAAALPTQVGGGIRTIKSAREALAARAKKIIIGSSLFTGGITMNSASRSSSLPSMLATDESQSRAGRKRSRSRPKKPSARSTRSAAHSSTRTLTPKA